MQFEEKDEVSINLTKYPQICIYFLISNKEVVYVGQTRVGLTRPLQHRDKHFDEVKMIKCSEDKLDEVEEKYIVKYDPKYNKTGKSVINYSLNKVQNKIKKIFGITIDMQRLKEIIDNLKIEIYINDNSTTYIKRCDFEKIFEYMDKKGRYECPF